MPHTCLPRPPQTHSAQEGLPVQAPHEHRRHLTPAVPEHNWVPKCLGVELHPRVWAAPPHSSGNLSLPAAWLGSRGLGRGFPLAQPAKAPSPRGPPLPGASLSSGPPCPPQRLCCRRAGWWPSSEQASSLRLPGSPAAHILVYRAPDSARACRWDVLRFLLAPPSRWGGVLWAFWRRFIGAGPPDGSLTAPRQPARFPGESGFWARPVFGLAAPRPARSLLPSGVRGLRRRGGGAVPAAAGTSALCVREQVERRELGRGARGPLRSGRTLKCK